MANPALDRFARALEDPIDLGRAALLLGLGEDPDLDVDAWLAELDRLGRELEQRLSPEDDAEARLRALSGFLFAEVGLLGNEGDYYDPRNSYLDQVLQRGLGIPISLAVVTIEVARRAGIELYGVGFPAHFLVGCGDERFLDPFHQGRLLDRQGCVELLNQLAGRSVGFSDAFLAPVDVRSILTRMLRNLKGTHLRRGALDQALLDVERLMLLDVGPEERRDRGLIHLARGAFPDAVEDLEAYLAADPPDAEVLLPRLENARRMLEGED